jgi:membrane protein
MAKRRSWPGRVLREIIRRLREHDLMMMAAAIAFYWLLAFIPLLLLGTSALGFFLGSSDRALDEIMSAARRVLPRGAGPDFEVFLRSVIRSRHITGVVGAGVLVWVAMGVFEIIASSLTALCGERETRSFLRRKVVALLMMCTVGFLMLVALMGSWVLAAWPEIENLLGLRIELPAFLEHPDFPRYLSTGLMGVLLAIVYRIAPVRAIRWPAALLGATLAAALWHEARVYFAYYLIRQARYNPYFGLLGSIIGMVLWIFWSAIILLFGGVVGDVIDRGGRSGDAGK